MRVFVVYIDTGSSVLSIPSKSRDLADEKKKFDGMEMIRNNCIERSQQFIKMLK